MIETLRDLVGSGRAFDIVLAVIVIEALVLIAWRGRERTLTVVTALLPGVFLLLAARAAATGGDPLLIAFWLACSFPPHLIDLFRRKP
jgi:hypothetical protein